MKNTACLLSFTVMACLALAGCASIVKGSTQSISITTNVDGATLFLDGVEIGTSPFLGIVKKNKEELKIVKDGYRTETIVMSKTLEGLFWGNIIIGGTLGSITDFGTGAAYTYAPATYQIDLKANEQSMLEYNRELSARRFSMIYIDEISRDLAAGEGEYLSALIEIVGAEAEDVRIALKSSGGNQVAFGNAVVALI